MKRVQAFQPVNPGVACFTADANYDPGFVSHWRQGSGVSWRWGEAVSLDPWWLVHGWSSYGSRDLSLFIPNLLVEKSWWRPGVPLAWASSSSWSML